MRIACPTMLQQALQEPIVPVTLSDRRIGAKGNPQCACTRIAGKAFTWRSLTSRGTEPGTRLWCSDEGKVFGKDFPYGNRFERLRISKLPGGILRRRSKVTTMAFTPAPLIAATDHWGTWTVLLTAAAFGLWSERTKWGSTLSGALVSTLVALAASNVGIIAAEAPAYAIVNGYLLPLAVPLLLFAADLRRVLKSTGRLLIAFFLGSVATTVGTYLALLVIPMRSLGPDAWKIAAALMSRHIGGAVNYVAVTEALGVPASVVAAGLAADNLICAVYFTTLFTLASSIPMETDTRTSAESAIEPSGEAGQIKGYIQVLDGSIALALAAGICAAGVHLGKVLGFQGGSITCITALIVLLATAFPNWFGKYAPSGEGLATILMQIFFATVGASGSIASVLSTAPSLFMFSLVQVAIHLVIILGVGKLMGFDRKTLLLASNANVGGPTTVAGMCTAKGWRSFLIPSILAGILGIAMATFLSIIFGLTVLKKL